ncbi:RNA-binding protein [Neobacillus sp. D3-1R]|uniref:YlmH family RNA-binding protein n=1 Tax=Neobacillus sp. D3-1R TaxID=3445778 RepID=UPI003F9EFA7C
MNIYQHFRPEEREFIDQVIQWKNYVEDAYTPKLTDFLDPREQQIVKLIIGETTDIRCHFFGGAEYTERQRALIIPEYYQVENEDYQISFFEIEYPKKFVKIEHPQVLGSLMSLGIKREKFGDILIEGDRVQVVVAKEIDSYIQMQLSSIGRAKINLKEVSFTDVITIRNKWEEETTTVSSLRLDTVIAALYHISRQKSQLLIEQGLVKVNFTNIIKPSFECGEFDLISVRGYGRTKILSIEGKTKKDKWRITAGKQK